MKLGFASDNYAGISPEILQALSNETTPYAHAYGQDPTTIALSERLTELFSPNYNFYPCLTGTGANISGLTSLTTRLGAVICPQTAHIIVSESTAVHAIADLAVRAIPTLNGKLTPEDIDCALWGTDDPHKAQPQVVCISQPTECGTVYSLTELQTLIDHAHNKGLKVHMDGCRLPLAMQFLGCSLAQTSTDQGVDTLLLGGTKMGAMIGEILLAKEGIDIPGYLKLNSQYFSKMRYISAQMLALYGTEGLYIRNAYTANHTAHTLAHLLKQAHLAPFDFVYPIETNTIFARIPPDVRAYLSQSYHFYDWNDGSVRWITNFSTTLDEIHVFADAIISAYSHCYPTTDLH